MALDVSAGLSQMGESVGKVAGLAALEQQKSGLEAEKIRLANDLAGQREEKQRQFTTSERVSTQQFTSGENKENRDNAVKLANITADAAVKSAGIHAGGTIAAANISATSHLAGIDKQLAQNKPLIDAEALAKSITNTNAQMVQDARKEITDARASGDPARVRAAQQKEYDATYSSQAQVQQVSLYQSQAKLIESALTAAQTKLVALQDPMKTMTPESKAVAAQLQKQVDDLQRQFQAAVKTAEDAVKNLPAYNPPTGGAPGAPDLNKYLKPQAAPQQPGMINQPPQ